MPYEGLWYRKFQQWQSILSRCERTRVHSMTNSLRIASGLCRWTASLSTTFRRVRSAPAPGCAQNAQSTSACTLLAVGIETELRWAQSTSRELILIQLWFQSCMKMTRATKRIQSDWWCLAKISNSIWPWWQRRELARPMLSGRLSRPVPCASSQRFISMTRSLIGLWPSSRRKLLSLNVHAKFLASTSWSRQSRSRMQTSARSAKSARGMLLRSSSHPRLSRSQKMMPTSFSLWRARALYLPKRSSFAHWKSFKANSTFWQVAWLARIFSEENLRVDFALIDHSN